MCHTHIIYWSQEKKGEEHPNCLTQKRSDLWERRFWVISNSSGVLHLFCLETSILYVCYHNFEWAFPSRAKSRLDERRPIALKTNLFDFPHRGEIKKHPWDRNLRGRFHTTILSGLFQAGQKARVTNVVQLRSKRVFSIFPMGAKRKNTLGIEFHGVGFIPPF